MTILHLDIESRSEVDLTKVGVYVYAAHPSTQVHLACFAKDDGPVGTWRRGEPVPELFIQAVAEGWTICAQNAAFERVMIWLLMSKRYGWPVPKTEQWCCTMAMALALSLPGSLKNATRAVGMHQGGKAEDGHLLMLQMCKPRRPRKSENPEGTYWFEDADRLDRLGEVCSKDVEDERELHSRLLELRPSEQALWVLDQKINDRGVCVDVELCERALAIVAVATDALDAELDELTGGAVPAATQVAKLATWLRLEGFQMESLDKNAIDDALAGQTFERLLTPAVRRALEIRREAAKASVKKIEAIMKGRNSDNRARGLLQFHAAGTGRWAGRRFQPQNIVRPTLESEVDNIVQDILAGHSAESLRSIYGEPLGVVGDILRGMVIAARGNRLYAADFANIEGRLQAWVGGEQWKLDAFRAFDAGTGHDIYKITAAAILTLLKGTTRTPDDITKPERQGYGKVPELALGYQGGVGAFQKMAAIYGAVYTDAQADEIKIAWRAKHPGIEQCWHDFEYAAKRAIWKPGEVTLAPRVAFRVVGSFLLMRLPSGRCIAYPYPCIKDKMTPWGKWKPTVSYKGVDTFTHQWTDCYAHGGLIFNNFVQGVARDLEADAMLRVEAAGYPVILSVHDEVVSETKLAFGSVAEFRGLITDTDEIYAGLPVAADAWTATRYHK